MAAVSAASSSSESSSSESAPPPSRRVVEDQDERSARDAGSSTTASTKAASDAGIASTLTRAVCVAGKIAGDAETSVQLRASAMAPAAGRDETGQRGGGDSDSVSSGTPTAGAVAVVILAERTPPPPLPPLSDAALPPYETATPAASIAAPTEHVSTSVSPRAGGCERYKLAPVGGSASLTRSRQSGGATANGGSAAAALPLASGVSAATAGSAGGSGADSSSPQCTQGGEGETLGEGV